MTDQEKLELLMTQQENMALKHRLISMDIEALQKKMQEEETKPKLEAVNE